MNEFAAGAVHMTEYLGSFNLFARPVALFQAPDPTLPKHVGSWVQKHFCTDKLYIEISENLPGKFKLQVTN